MFHAFSFSFFFAAASVQTANAPRNRARMSAAPAAGPQDEVSRG
jgi:hypothetical protein